MEQGHLKNMAIKKISNDAYKLTEDRCKSKILKILPESEGIEIGLSPAQRESMENLKNDEKVWELTKTEPLLIDSTAAIDITGSAYGCHLWLYQNCLYVIPYKQHYSKEEMKLMVLDTADKERQKFERLRTKFDSESSKEIRFQRPRIPEEIRITVWRRDQGRCVRCGKQENLEYDHIIPISKGGSNTVRNIELLCEKCNREKGNRVQ